MSKAVVPESPLIEIDYDAIAAAATLRHFGEQARKSGPRDEIDLTVQ